MWSKPRGGGSSPTNLDDLINVNAPTPQTGQYLKFNGSEWVPEAPPSSGGGSSTLDGLQDVTAPSPVSGQYLTFNGSQWVAANFPTSSTVVTNQWEGKTWTVIGDSITDVNFQPEETKYHAYVKTKLNIAMVKNHGFAGYTLARGSNVNNIVDQITAAPAADLYTAFGGTNDYNTDKPAGTITSTDVTTIYGALHFICQYLINNRPDAKYALFTPLRRSNNWSAATGVIKLGRGANGGSGLTLENIADIVLEVGHYYSIPVLDLLRKSGIEPSFDPHKTRYMPDGLHPNAAGHQRISNVIAEFLKTI